MSPSSIADLNDAFRTSFEGGHVVITQGVAAHHPKVIRELYDKVKAFRYFVPENDPHGEHDFGQVLHSEVAGPIFWKIDYYDHSMTAGSEDPSDPAKTARVLTIMLASEY